MSYKLSAGDAAHRVQNFIIDIAIDGLLILARGRANPGCESSYGIRGV